MLLFGASGAVARSWSARLPDPVATHWGLRGVDRTAASLPGLLAGWLGIAVVLCVAVAAISLAGNQPPFTRRLAAAVSIGSATCLGGCSW